MAWSGLGFALYVWFKLGLGTAIAFLVIPFIVSAALELAEGRVFQSPPRASTVIGTPIALLSFVMLLRAVVAL
jgi:type III secretory pathway component EscR